MKVDIWVSKLNLQEVFITIKTHKPDFQNNLQYRLLNLTRNITGKLTKSSASALSVVYPQDGSDYGAPQLPVSCILRRISKLSEKYQNN